jgi:7-cyano-7-deazaguanine reductase
MSATPEAPPENRPENQSGNQPDPEAVAVLRNPASHHDYLIEWAGEAPGGNGLKVRYVPDRDVITRHGWLELVDRLPAENAEAVAITLLRALDDMLLARWIEVSVFTETGHRVVIEDRQPGWHNDKFLARLAPL